MGFDRSKKRVQLWKKAAIHFALCFVMGFFTGFAPTSTASLFSSQANPYRSISNLGISAQPAQSQPLQKPSSATTDNNNRSLLSDEIPASVNSSVEESAPPRDLLIVVTTTRPGDRFLGPWLRRLGHTLRLVPSPLLWIVVEAHGDAPRTPELLRRTGIMYRHLTYKENFTDPNAEADHQRNVALNHIEYHRLDGIVHFADVSNVYHLDFFEQIREIE